MFYLQSFFRRKICENAWPSLELGRFCPSLTLMTGLDAVVFTIKTSYFSFIEKLISDSAMTNTVQSHKMTISKNPELSNIAQSQTLRQLKQQGDCQQKICLCRPLNNNNNNNNNIKIFICLQNIRYYKYDILISFLGT